jgi:hypothetical protein
MDSSKEDKAKEWTRRWGKREDVQERSQRNAEVAFFVTHQPFRPSLYLSPSLKWGSLNGSRHPGCENTVGRLGRQQ